MMAGEKTLDRVLFRPSRPFFDHAWDQPLSPTFQGRVNVGKLSTSVAFAEKIPDELKIVLRGIGQVMFQDNALSGLIFLVGIAIASPLMAAGGLVGAVIGALTAKILKFNEAEYRDGIYGFNATLVGVATFFFYQPNLTSVLLLLAGCVLTTILTMILRKAIPFPTYTTAFIVVTWGLVLAGDSMQVAMVAHPPGPEVLDMGAAITEGLSEVFLQANRVTGVLFFVAIAVNNWRHALLGLLGSLVGTIVGLYHQDPLHDVSIGIYGYNGSLVAIALYLWRASSIPILLGVILSTPITEHFPHLGIPTLTAPFVLASWMVIGLGWLDHRLSGPKSGS